MRSCLRMPLRVSLMIFLSLINILEKGCFPIQYFYITNRFVAYLNYDKIYLLQASDLKITLSHKADLWMKLQIHIIIHRSPSKLIIG